MRMCLLLKVPAKLVTSGVRSAPAGAEVEAPTVLPAAALVRDGAEKTAGAVAVHASLLRAGGRDGKDDRKPAWVIVKNGVGRNQRLGSPRRDHATWVRTGRADSAESGEQLQVLRQHPVPSGGIRTSPAFLRTRLRSGVRKNVGDLGGNQAATGYCSVAHSPRSSLCIVVRLDKI